MKHLVLPTIKTFRLNNTTFEGKPIAEAMTAAAAAVADSRERVRKAAATLEAAEAGAKEVAAVARAVAAAFHNDALASVLDDDAEDLSAAFREMAKDWAEYEEATYDPGNGESEFKPRAELVKVPGVTIPAAAQVRKYDDVARPMLDTLCGCVAEVGALAAARRELDAARAAEAAAVDAFIKCARRILDEADGRDAYIASLAEFAKEADAARQEWRDRMAAELQ